MRHLRGGSADDFVARCTQEDGRGESGSGCVRHLEAFAQHTRREAVEGIGVRCDLGVEPDAEMIVGPRREPFDEADRVVRSTEWATSARCCACHSPIEMPRPSVGFVCSAASPMATMPPTIGPSSVVSRRRRFSIRDIVEMSLIGSPARIHGAECAHGVQEGIEVVGVARERFGTDRRPTTSPSARTCRCPHRARTLMRSRGRSRPGSCSAVSHTPVAPGSTE